MTATFRPNDTNSNTYDRYPVEITNKITTFNTASGTGSGTVKPVVSVLRSTDFDSLRITKGVARYTHNFDPETDTYLAY